MANKKSKSKNKKEALKNNIHSKENSVINPNNWAIFYKDKAWAVLLAMVAGISALYTFIYYYFISESKVTEIMNEQLTADMSEVFINNSKSIGSALKLAVIMMFMALLTVLIVGGIYYMLVVSLRGQIKFKQMLTIYSAAYIITILGEFIIEIFGKLTNSSFMAGSDPYMKVWLNQVNPFEILSLVFIFYGIKAFTAMSNKKIITTIIIVVAGSILFNMMRVSISQSLLAI